MPKTEPFDKHIDEYEQWFIDNDGYYKSELEAVRHCIDNPEGFIELGVGSGLFAEPLGIKKGIEPSSVMAEAARKRGIEVIEGRGENIPLPDSSCRGILMVTTICFLDDADTTLKECYRILKEGGKIVIGFVDRESPIGKEYLKIKERSVFYRDAVFFSTNEILKSLQKRGFRNIQTVQTLLPNKGPKDMHPIRKGFGEGSFVVICAEK